MVPSRWMTYIGRTVRFQETLRRLAMIDEGFVEDQAGLELDPAGASALDPKTAALLRVGACVATGVAAYEQHLRLHQQVERATGIKAAIALLLDACLAVSGLIRPS